MGKIPSKDQDTGYTCKSIQTCEYSKHKEVISLYFDDLCVNVFKILMTMKLK